MPSNKSVHTIKNSFCSVILNTRSRLLGRLAAFEAHLKIDMCAEEENAAGTGAARETDGAWLDEVEKAADLLIEIYGAQSLQRARSVQAHSLVESFAVAVTSTVERKLRSMQ